MSSRSHKDVELTGVGCHLDVRDQEKESWRNSAWLEDEGIIHHCLENNGASEEQQWIQLWTCWVWGVCG